MNKPHSEFTRRRFLARLSLPALVFVGSRAGAADTGAVRGSETFNVRRFGARGDGTTLDRSTPAPVSAFTLWKWDDVKLTKGDEFLGKFKSSDISDRRYCTKCGSHISVDHPTLGLIDVRLGAHVAVLRGRAEQVLQVDTGLQVFRRDPALEGGRR